MSVSEIRTHAGVDLGREWPFADAGLLL
jgi:hypothetical protein